jgi:hypothetical protein
MDYLELHVSFVESDRHWNRTNICTNVASKSWGTAISNGLFPEQVKALTDSGHRHEDIVRRRGILLIRRSPWKVLVLILILRLELRGGLDGATGVPL